mgnify:CR=1 FL=1
MDNKKQEILETAEKMVREGGYNSFSFRDIATAVGVKSSSVHYYFPTKSALGAAVVTYYTDKFLNHLGDPHQLMEEEKDLIRIYIQAFRSALTKDKRMCLCGLLGAEVGGLPPEVVAETKAFFERNIEWLTTAYTLKSGEKEARENAMKTLSLLEGAMILSNVLGDIKAFDEALMRLDD